jgi:hypothetical protein
MVQMELLTQAVAVAAEQLVKPAMAVQELLL